MNTRVLVIGIDSMDRQLLSKYIENLPNFRQIRDESPTLKITSVFPPDSDTAWASIYTGLNPAKHGVVDFVDPLEKAFNILTKETDTSQIKGRTFWDYVSRSGKKVTILLPHICYPPWNVNGIMVSRAKSRNSVLSVPEEVSKEYDLNKLNTPKGVPRRDTKSLKKLISEYEDLISNETGFFLKMIKNTEWDLFFAYSSALDAIQHYFWNYCDENDPEYPGDNPFKNVIKYFYRLYDDMVGKLISSVEDDTIVIILSDHGHGRRPLKLLNVNEVLRRSGFLATSTNPVANSVEKIKTNVAKLVSRYNLGWLASRILRLIPQAKDIYSHPLSIDWESTLAYASDLSGIKAYSYGGIKINRENLNSKEEYEILRDKIIRIFSEIKDPNGNKVVRWILKREELYEGEYITKYPDIVLQLDEDYGIGHRINAPLIDRAYTSTVVPGSHKGDNAVFFIISNKDINIRTNLSLMDVAPTVLDLLGIDWRRFDFDGRSIIEK